MLSIQDAGSEILNNRPRKFYAFIGDEYGIKKKYLTKLEEFYGCSKECDHVEDVFKHMSTKHLIPLNPCLYVVRYDDSFLSSIDSNTYSRIQSMNILGTIVCIYESSKNESKLEKYIPDFTVRIDRVDSRFVRKYLRSDFPALPDELIDVAVKYGCNYNDSQNICNSLSKISPEVILRLSEDSIAKLLGKRSDYTDSHFRKGVASKSYTYLVDVVDNYSGELSNLLYTILHTLLDIEGVLSSKYSESDLKIYSDRWDAEDVYNMFMQTYREIERLRTYSQDMYCSLMYLISLLSFRKIPSVEVL